jgi:hypothetical protein
MTREQPPRLPPGYSLETAEPDFLILRRTDGSVVGIFSFSALGPAPESVSQAAEKDHRVLEGEDEG